MTVHHPCSLPPSTTRLKGVPSPSTPRSDSRWDDLERLRSSHPMMDAVIDEVAGPAHPRRRAMAVRFRVM